MPAQEELLSELDQRPLDRKSSALVLSIHPDHAARIYAGAKHYELRRALPSLVPRRVFLYETGTGAIAGCFDVSRVLFGPPDKLWAEVGEAATTRERFFKYFEGSERGFALEVSRPIRLQREVRLEQLRIEHPKLTAPMSFLVLGPSAAAAQLLERARRATLAVAEGEVTLRAILPEEREEFKALVLKHVGASYDDIDASFAERTLYVHDLGRDPVGLLTSRKEVLTAVNHTGARIGFTTLTYKVGGAVKSGPSILLERFRGRGLGQQLRRAIERRALASAARKVYCTAPATATQTVRYLLDSGMRVEAHLSRHYAADHDELVFGKVLRDGTRERGVRHRDTDRRFTLRDPKLLSRNDLEQHLVRFLPRVWTGMTPEYARQIVTSVLDVSGGAAQKQRHMVFGWQRGRLVACALLVPKRGGSAKLVLLGDLGNRDAMRRLLKSAEKRSERLRMRRLYSLVPVDSGGLIAALLAERFLTEGVLREPYEPGRDVLVLGKALDRQRR